MTFDPVGVARRAVELYVGSGERPAAPAELAGRFLDQAGTFVCIKRRGELRGCIGTILPAQETLYAEIIENAIGSATRDPRFLPIDPAELAELAYSVDILSPAEPVTDLSMLDPKVYGIIIRSCGRTGLLLPLLEGVDSVERQIDIARRKAGITAGEPLEIARFTVERFTE